MSGRIARVTVETVKERGDLAELFEARVGPGRRTGGQIMFRCPFHDERTASCRVHPAEKVFHCFGCGEGGDLIGFVMKVENLPFDGAVEWLAERYGVDVEYEELTRAERERIDRSKRVEHLLDDVASFYERFLAQSPQAAAARTYLEERQIPAASIERFRVGFAPSDWDRMSRAAVDRGYPAQMLYDAGVATPGRHGPVDRFRNRIVFPLADARGRIRGFGARIMPGDEGAKYINSSESETFKKGRLLYGLHLARQPIARAHRAIVVEGYTDVIALHEAGFEETVASMGTALTEDQVRELRRLADLVVLCFDADAAGQEAAMRGMTQAEASGLRVRVALLPAGDDPADVVRRSRAAFEEVLGRTESVLSFRVGRALALQATDGPDAAYAECRKILAAAQPGPERDEQVRRVAGALRLAPDTAAALVPARTRFPRQPDPSRLRVHRDRRTQTEMQLLAGCLALPSRGAAVLDEAAPLIASEPLAALVPWARARIAGDAAGPPAGLEAASAEVLAHVADFDVETDDGRRATSLSLDTLMAGLELADVENRITTLKERLRTDEYTREDQSALNDLQRERQSLRDRLFRAPH
jgi:DNA primase